MSSEKEKELGVNATSTTERAQYHFKVSEGEESEDTWRAFISTEPLQGNLKIIGNGLLSFDLKPGTSIERAEEIAGFLNENIEAIAYTYIYE